MLGLSGTTPGPLLRNSIQARKAGDDHEQAPGFAEADLVLHCGPTLAGGFAQTLTVTDAFTEWTENTAVKNGAHWWCPSVPAISPAVFDDANPTELTCRITAIQHKLTTLAKDKTIAIYRVFASKNS